MKKCSVDDCDRPNHAHGFCGLHAQRFRRYGRTDFAQKTFTKEYFESCLTKDVGGCWLWSRVILTTGYAQFFGKLAHRVSYEFYKSKIPAGAIVMHSCDIRHCVNPDHLSIGTHKLNMLDALQKNRLIHHPAKRGLEHPHSKFVAADIEEIKTRHASGESMRSIAKSKNVGHSTISKVVNGLRYIVTFPS